MKKTYLDKDLNPQSVVGRTLEGHGGFFFVDAWSQSTGFFLTNIDTYARKTISERAVDKSLHTLNFMNDKTSFTRWTPHINAAKTSEILQKIENTKSKLPELDPETYGIQVKEKVE